LRTINVKLKNNPYKIHIGSGILGRAGALLRPLVRGDRVMIVSNKKVFGLYGSAVTLSLRKKFKCSVHLMPDGEKHKTLDTVRGILEACAKAGLDRGSTILALGGGVVGDIAGFAAAIYMRGINLAQVPTTLVAQVDSSIGGKTGVDLKYGKNLAGAFYQPLFVLSDVLTLKTLPEEEFKNGLAEAIKHGIILDAGYFTYFARDRQAILRRETQALLRVVTGSAGIKAEIVAKDEKERGLRVILNYGHTVGHAIEAAGGYKTLKHGQAIVIGMIIAARLAYKMGICTKSAYNEQIHAFNSFNLIKPLKNPRINSIIKRLYNDKKALNGKIRFILTNKIGCVRFIESIEIKRIKEELVFFSGLNAHKEDALYAG
jgi:3-dehydroquinate synthase